MQTSTITRVALMATLTAVGAQIAIPLPFTPVPFTLQVPAVVLSGLLLGVRHGALAQTIYLLVGAVGVPVFANFSGGLGDLVGPTGGYLISYPFAAATAGVAAGAVAGPPRRRAIAAGLASGLIGLAMIYALGATWLAVQSNLPPGAAFAAGVLPFVPFDVAKVLLATLVAVATAPVVSQVRTRRSSPAPKGRRIRWTSGT